MADSHNVENRKKCLNVQTCFCVYYNKMNEKNNDTLQKFGNKTANMLNRKY